MQKTFQKGVALAAFFSLVLGACSALPGGNIKQPTKIEIVSPQTGTQVNVNQSLNIQANVTGDSIVQIDVLVNNEKYAALTATDKAKGVSNFPVPNVPWTAKTPGAHMIQIKAYGPNEVLLATSDPLVVNARGAAAQPTQTSAPPTPAPPPTTAPPAATSAAVIAPTNAPAAAVQGAASAGAAELTVTNEFARVRGGPDTGYSEVGQLKQNEKAKVIGKSADGKWWQVSFKDGNGWVFGELASVNDAANNVGVAAAPPLAAAPAAAAAPVVVSQPAATTRPVVNLSRLPTAPPLPTAVPTSPPPTATYAPPTATYAPPPPTAVPVYTSGNRNVLKVGTNPLQAGSTVFASWNISNFSSGDFDRGDGTGYRGPINGQMQVEVPYVTSGRNINLRWKDTSGQEFIDTIALYTFGTAPAAPSAGGKGVLRVSPNPVSTGGTVIASWSNLPNFASGEFDKGDGTGFKGPIANTMNVSVDGINGNRTLTVRWRDGNNNEQTDSVQILVGGSSSASSSSSSTSSSSSNPDCNSGNANWRGNGGYPFCVRQDLEWDNSPTWKVSQGQDKSVTMRWNIYGIDGIRLKIEPSGQQCGPPGSSGRDVPVSGSNGTDNATYTFNVKDFNYGGYKLELFVEKSGKVYGYNEKFMCVGN